MLTLPKNLVTYPSVDLSAVILRVDEGKETLGELIRNVGTPPSEKYLRDSCHVAQRLGEYVSRRRVIGLPI